jgi:putative peptidoglycan lipid II flippase
MLNRAIELALLLGLPAAVGLGLLARPIIAVLFERGAFGPEATTATAEVLAGLALGLPAYVLTKVLAPGFFAIEDTRTPVRVAVLALAVNAVAALLLSGPLAHLGIALAISLSSWTNAFALALLLWRRGILVPDAAFRRRAGGTVAAVAIMAAVLLAIRAGLGGEGAATLALLIAAGGGSFLLAAWGTGAVDRRAMRQLWGASRA